MRSLLEKVFSHGQKRAQGVCNAELSARRAQEIFFPPNFFPRKTRVELSAARKFFFLPHTHAHTHGSTVTMTWTCFRGAPCMRRKDTVDEKMAWKTSHPNAYSTIIKPITAHKLCRVLIAAALAAPCAQRRVSGAQIRGFPGTPRPTSAPCYPTTTTRTHRVLRRPRGGRGRGSVLAQRGRSLRRCLQGARSSAGGGGALGARRREPRTSLPNGSAVTARKTRPMGMPARRADTYLIWSGGRPTDSENPTTALSHGLRTSAAATPCGQRRHSRATRAGPPRRCPARPGPPRASRAPAGPVAARARTCMRAPHAGASRAPAP